MEAIGIDIGSRSIEVVRIWDGRVTDMMRADTGHDPMAEIRRLLGNRPAGRVMATGYGRHMLEVEWEIPAITEIKAYAIGVHHIYREAQTILDIGGQDTKAITLMPDGRIRKFEMNDRCAAGTGKFLELMAGVLGYTLDTFGSSVLEAVEGVSINSMCAVFAESEVTSLVTRGVDRAAIGRGVHESVAKRAATMLHRVGWAPPLVFAGGVARNACMRRMMELMLGTPVQVPDHPEFVGALGAAIQASVLENHQPQLTALV